MRNGNSSLIQDLYQFLKIEVNKQELILNVKETTELLTRST